MEDREIIRLFWSRSEKAIVQTHAKYGRYCHYIAYQILQSDADAEETVNDTYLQVWNTVPPREPNPLKGYLAVISNRLAINRYEAQNAQKRGGNQITLVLEELSECVSGREGDMLDRLALKNALDRFLSQLPARTRSIFVRRYWYVASIAEIAEEFGMKESNVTVLMLRTRSKLKVFLEKEGIAI